MARWADKLNIGTLFQRNCADIISSLADAFELTVPGSYPTGSYTPTLSNTTNVGASTAAETYYSRSGNNVTVYGALNVDPTANTTLTELGISLPIASDITNAQHVSGTACAIAFNSSGGISGDTANNRATLTFISATDTNHTMRFHFSYRIV